MAIPLDKPVTCPVLIGRAAHLESLERALRDIPGGRGQTVLISGEAGIGKSRLVAEATARAERQGFAAFTGQCFEADRSIPYAPILDLLRARFARLSPEELARELGPSAPEVVRILPELAHRVTDLTPAVSLDPEADRGRVFHAIAEVLAAHSAVRPVIVAVEDLHWADATSLDLLLYLARRLAPRHPILLLLTYRGDDVSPDLSRCLAELDRGRLATELSLTPLTPAEVGAMLRALDAGGRLDRPEVLATIATLTEGNPFFVEEVAKAILADQLAATGTGPDPTPLDTLRLPRSVRDAVQRRLDRLSEPARQTIAIAAVAGRRFDFPLLQALTQADERTLIEVARELIAAQLIVEETADRFSFRHALTRQAIYSQLLARERRALHRRIGEALEGLAAGAAEERQADLALHLFEAEEWSKALDYAWGAGERAQALYAPAAAIEHYTRAIEAARRRGSAPPIDLLRARGRAYETVGDFDRARADLEVAQRLAGEAGDQSAEWRSRIDLGFLWLGRDHERAGRIFREALALARAIGDPATLAHSLNRAGNWYITADRPGEARRHHEEALAIFGELGDRRGIASTLDLLGMATAVATDFVQSEVYHDRAVALFREIDDRPGLVFSLAQLTLLRAGSFNLDIGVAPVARATGSLAEGEEALALARGIGWRAGEAWALYTLSDGAAAQGDYGRALTSIHASHGVADEIGHRPWLCAAHSGLGAIYLDLFAVPAARRHLDEALAIAREIGSPHWVHVVASFLAPTFLLQGDPAAADSLLRDALGDEIDTQAAGQRMALAALAEVALAMGRPDRALDIADRLIATAPNLTAGRAIPRLWKVRGEALAALGQKDEAATTLAEALRAAAARGERRILWRIHRALGKLEQSQGHRAAAGHAYAAARAIVEELAGSIPDVSLRATFLDQTAALIPSPRPLSPRRAAKLAFGGLTTREREVAALIAHGRSNRAIAEALTVTERTVEAHVGNILAKLGLTSRAQIAVWAAKRSLAGSPEQPSRPQESHPRAPGAL